MAGGAGPDLQDTHCLSWALKIHILMLITMYRLAA